jgi:hypothetical protein
MPERRPPARRARDITIEVAALLSAPAIAHFALRLQLMSRPGAPDPTIHSGYIFDPTGLFGRYGTTSASDVAIREGVRVGFVVPARICYLLFGAVPGFAVLRYLLALVAIVPVYVMFRRLAGRGAAAFAAALVLVSPVFVTSLGTDYPNSACVAYLTAGTASLFMPAEAKGRPVWVAVATAAYTMAFWSLDITLVLSGSAIVVWAAQRLRSEPRRLAVELAVAALVAVGASGCLSVASGLVLGRFDYVLPTLSSTQFLSGASQLARRHSSSWHWLPYLDYLLVLPVVVAAWLIVRGRRIVRLGELQNALGVLLVVQVAAFTYLQFAAGLWTLEDHYFSSMLWPACLLVLAAVGIELVPGLFSDRRTAWVPAFVVVGLEWGYEAVGQAWRFDWGPTGTALAMGAVVAVVLTKASGALLRRVPPAVTAVTAVGSALLMALLLALTVAVPTRHGRIAGVATYPPADYGDVLGQSDAVLIDRYRISAMVPGFVGPPEYPGERLMTWWPSAHASQLYPVMGVYHADMNAFGESSYPYLSAAARAAVERDAPGEVLLVDLDSSRFGAAVRSLRPFAPKVLRTGVLRAGSVSFAVRLVQLQAFTRRHRR